MAACVPASLTRSLITLRPRRCFSSTRSTFTGYAVDYSAQAVEDKRAAPAAGPMAQYLSLLAEGALREDEHQKAVMERLDQMHRTLRIHRLKQSMPKRKAGKMAKSYDPIAPIAEEISEEACLLCFDEFQMPQIRDPTIPEMTM
ncbi:hypothetical protein CRUP_017407, partial [Coryphaenoides rupestris]